MLRFLCTTCSEPGLNMRLVTVLFALAASDAGEASATFCRHEWNHVCDSDDIIDRVSDSQTLWSQQLLVFPETHV